MAEVEWSSLVAALGRVEQLSPTDSGMLSFGETPVGGIFVERGRVCWVAARGLEQRLRDLLRTHSNSSAGDLERMYERCRAEGRVLGEALVEEGSIQPDELQRALRRHSAECLVDLCRSRPATSWASHGGRGYAPRFTFRAIDLLFDSVALYHADLQRSAQTELARYAGSGRRCAAYVLDRRSESPLPLAEVGGHSIEGLLALGRAIARVPEASFELGTTPAFTLSTTAAGETSLSWWRDAALYSVSCADRESLAAVTARHLTGT